MTRITAAVAAFAMLAGAAAADDTYKLTGENTKVEFIGKKTDGKHEGGFKKLSGTATAGDGGIKIEAEIDCNSMYTDDPKLTGHLKSPDFFGVKDHPTAAFKSTKVEKKDSGYTVTGELTLCGKTKEITFPAQIQTGDTFVLKAEFPINRNDFGMSYGKGKIEDEVVVKVSTDAKK